MIREVRPIPDGTILIDCYAPLSGADCQKLSANVYAGRPIAGVGRYVETLSPEEIDTVLSCGLGLFTVGVAHDDSMSGPTAGLGYRDGLKAVGRLRELGIPPGVTHAIDVERTVRELEADEIAAYVNAADSVIQVETTAALYEGWGLNISRQDLYRRLTVSRYWASSPQSPPPDKRGFSMVQLVENVTLSGIQVDVDEARMDLLGGSFSWLIAAA